MPAKNRIKQYGEDYYYHVYNRGVEKRIIFLDEQDYGVFLKYLKEYLLPKDEKALIDQLSNPSLPSARRDEILRLLRLNNFNGEITLVAYCLMPNHFHFLLKQKDYGSMDKFMNSLGTRYTMYFNKKYKRVGSLYQGVYKAVIVSSDEQLLHLSRYIHKQALASKGQALQGVSRDEQPSSYSEYIGKRKTEWVKLEELLGFFSHNNPTLSYESFVNQEELIEPIYNLLLENY